MYNYKTLLLICLVLVIVIILAYLIVNYNTENLSIQKQIANSSPPFKYPIYIQQPPGPEGWGFRDPNATKMTLEWEQCQKPILMPDYSPQRIMTGYRQHMVPSEPVKIKQSNCKIPQQRPPQYNIPQSNVAVAPYSTWAGTVGAALPLSS
jgi:hypothetical protein